MSRFGGGIKRDKTDILFSHLVRERVNWVCEYCKRDFSHRKGSLHCSHIFGRARKSVRWHPLNALAHCVGCHDRLGQHPLDFAQHAKQVLGDNNYIKLQYHAGKPLKWSKHDKELLHKHYLREKKRILALRLEGEQGRIEFKIF